MLTRRGWFGKMLGAVVGAKVAPEIPPVPKICTGEYRSGGWGRPSVSYHFIAVENISTGEITWVRHV